MNTIIFKSYYLNKALYWLIFLEILVAIFVFLELNLSVEDKYQLSVSIAGLGAMFVIYSNRKELHYIKFNEDEFTVDYVNKLIFKSEVKTYAKGDLKSLSKNDTIVLSENTRLKAIIRKKAMEINEWSALEQYFSESNMASK